MKRNVIAIVGRPNVGKSTLFNRIIGKSHSIVSEVEGVTRDRVKDSFDWKGTEYDIIDTGGFINNSKDIMSQQINIQSSIAQQESDLILLVMDSRQDITSTDRELAQIVLKSNKPYIFVLNKVDIKQLESNKDKFYELGLNEPILVSAQSGGNVGDLLDQISILLVKENVTDKQKYDFSVAIVGTPNVGKSSFINKILNKDYAIVTDIAGTTRDSIDSNIKYYNKVIRLIDTAGLRKKTKITEKIEFYSTVRTERSIEECDIAIVMLDSSKDFGKQEQDIIRNIIDKGKGMVLAVNKWDLISNKEETMDHYINNMIYKYRSISNYPIIFISVKENKRVRQILSKCLEVFNEKNKRIKTNVLNDWLNKILNQNPPPSVKGKNLKIKYVSQIRQNPPLFVFHSNFPEMFPVAYKRFLENQIRSEFGFNGVSMKISFRKK